LSRPDECWSTRSGRRIGRCDLVISQTLMDTLEGLDLIYHAPVEDLSGIVVE
jgi:hypothetical protein